MEDARVSSSYRENPKENPSFLLQDCRKDQRPGEVDYETRLPDLGEKPNQPTSFNFPKRCFGIKSVTYVTRFAKTRNNPAFLKTQIIASWCSAHLKPSSVVVSSL